jgi:hypothetical protein
MERRDFILKSGTILTAAAFFGMFGNSNNLFGATTNSADKKNSKKRPDSNAFSQPILKAIAIGINAPSAHNTQSWKFKIINDTSMYLYVNENILLPATDPPSRQIHISAGCFIETLVVGATTLGYKSTVTYFPEGYESQRDFGVKSVAKIELLKISVNSDSLSSYINARQTNRREYKGELISKQEFETLKEIAGNSHSQLVFINENFKPYFEIFNKGFEIESRTFRTNEETRNLFRFSEKQRAEKGDGISIPQMGYHGMMKFLAESSLDNGNKEKWHSDKSIKLSMKNVAKGIESSKGIVIWITEANTFEDWIKSGRDYVRFSLALTKQNLYAHPYNQAIQEYDEMKAVRDDLDKLLNIKGNQKIQMVVRIGRSSEPYLSYRRPLDTYIIK